MGQVFQPNVVICCFALKKSRYAVKDWKLAGYFVYQIGAGGDERIQSGEALETVRLHGCQDMFRHDLGAIVIIFPAKNIGRVNGRFQIRFHP